MTNTFLNKIVAERRVLSLVNKRYRGPDQLAGLSHTTIERWRQGHSRSPSPELLDCLHRLAELCQSLSDISQDSTKPLDPAVEKGIDEGMARLGQLLA